ncbi:MAG: alpha/beta fold hydrolase [Luteitalea sp.]|nr:alpha/beta fold hydrolase [Luteitalea sp.]
MVVRGHGPTLVLVPGINGRWEWLRPGFEALAKRLRVVTFSYRGEPGAPPLPPRCADFDLFVRQVDEAAHAAAATRVVVCGVSYGGWVALRYASQHPDRVAALILVCTPPPPPDVTLGWRYDHYVRHPWLYAPAFLLLALRRTVAELRSTFPGIRCWLPFLLRHLRTIMRAPQSPRRTVRRWELAQHADLHADCRRVTAPTLLVTGEAELDGVVPTQGTLSYLALIRGANAATLPSTGHLGLVTKPQEFARIVCEFIDMQGLGARGEGQERDQGSGNRGQCLTDEPRLATETLIKN